MHVCASHACLLGFPGMGLGMIVRHHVGARIEPRAAGASALHCRANTPGPQPIFIQPNPSGPGVAPSTVGWALQNQSVIDKENASSQTACRAFP